MYEKCTGATGNKPYTVAQFAEECVTWRWNMAPAPLGFGKTDVRLAAFPVMCG